MNKLWICSTVFIYSLAWQAPIQSPSPQEQDNNAGYGSARILMEAKLSNSEQILRGLVTEDFESIEKAAAKLKKIAEAAHWPTTIDEVYQHHSYEFRNRCDKLVENAKKRDLRAAHFSFLHLSGSCVDCHEYVRSKFRIKRKKQGPIFLIPTEWDQHDSIQRPAPDDTVQFIEPPKPTKLR